MINAVIPMWKPVDWTSFDVVRKIRSQIKPAKVGHAGTLDPFAEGVLMLCTGKFTKKVEYFMDKEKEYIADIRLGKQTDTLDLTGSTVKLSDVPKLTQNKILKAVKLFIGDIKQEPPMFSALKVNGQPLYKSARKGLNIPRKKRIVRIYDIKLISFNENTITLMVTCGRGTYIRSLAKDIAKQLNTVGHLVSLKRTRIGEYEEKNCIYINDFPEWISVQT